MKKLIAIGEALIDFIPKQTGFALKEVTEFKPMVGGAPANVCGAYAKLGFPAGLITKLGQDAFGDKIVDYLKKAAVDVSMIYRTAKANTCLAFVSLKQDGERDFSFYRNPSADMLLEPFEIKKEFFDNAGFLHFCSVSLGNYPMREAHKQAIQYARNAGLTISFDPNIRLPLWEDHAALKKVIWEFIPSAHILKISEDELAFITGCSDVKKALSQLFCGNVQLILITGGDRGAEAYTRFSSVEDQGVKVAAKDTTGAGDAFIGSFLFQLAKCDINRDMLHHLNNATLAGMLHFSNQYCAYSVTRNGAIGSYATFQQIKKFLKEK